MGFFSWDCKGCGHSIREGHGWMGKAVVRGQNGDTATGTYDGYGRLDGSFGTVELTDHGGKFALWHRACFVLKGRPDFSGTSRMSDDQGMPPADELPEPQTAQDVDDLLKVAVAKRAAAREEAKRFWTEYEAKKAQEAVDGTTH